MSLTDHRILRAMSTDSFSAKAYAQYLDSVAKDYAELQEMLTDAASANFPESIEVDEGYDTINVVATVNRIISEHPKYTSNSPIITTYGSTTLGEALAAVVRQCEAYSDPEADSSSALVDTVIDVFACSSDNESKLGSISVAALAEDVQATLHSTVAQAATAWASLQTTASDRLSVFRDRVGQTFSDAYNDVSGATDFYVNLLKDEGAQASDILHSLIQTIDFTPLGNSASLRDATSFSYTGCSLVPAISWSSIKAVAQATAFIAWNTGKAIVEAVISFATPIFKTMIKKTVSVFNPYDLVDSGNEDYAPIVDGWSYDSGAGNILIPVGDNAPGYLAANRFVAFLKEYQQNGDWIKYDTVFGETCCRFSNATTIERVSVPITPSGFSYYVRVNNYDVKFAPKLINRASISKWLLGSTGITINGVTGGTPLHPDASGYYIITLNNASYNAQLSVEDNIENLFAWLETGLNRLKESGELYYQDLESVSEADAYLGLTLAGSLQGLFCYVENSVNAYRTAKSVNPNVEPDDIIWINSSSGTTFTFNIYCHNALAGHELEPSNRDFVAAASGWDGDTLTPSFSSNQYYFDPHSIVDSWIYQRYCEFNDPTNFPFVPFLNTAEGIDRGRYTVRTDQQNQNALTTFMTVCFVVVVTIVAAIAIGVTASKIKKAKYLRRTQITAACDNKMWSASPEPGEDGWKRNVLTRRERRQYLRAQKKLNASELISGQVRSSVGSTISGIFKDAISQNTDQKTEETYLRYLITG